MLLCAPDRDLLEALQDLDADPVPSSFHSYLSRDDACEESHYGETQETSYGDRLTCVSVSRLLRFRDHEGVRDSPRNRAVWAYLAELLPETRVALYWH